MPRREDIEKFKQVLNSLGSEPAIKESRSESIEDVAPPGAAAQTAVEEGADVELGLSSLPGDELAAVEAPSEETGPAAQPAGGEVEGGPGLDFASLFGEETEAPAIKDLEAPAKKPARGSRKGREAAAAAKAEAEAAAARQAAEEETFAFPEGEPSSLLADLDQMEVLPEDLGEPVPPPSAAESVPIEAGGAEIPEQAPEAEPSGPFEDFGMFAQQEPEAAAPPEAEAPQPAAEGIELPDLEDLSLGEALGGVEQAAPGEGVSFEEPAAAPELETPADFALGEEPAMPAEGEEIPPTGEVDLGAPGAAPVAEPAMESLGEEGLGDLGLEGFSFAEAPEQFGIPEVQPEMGKPAKPSRVAPPRAPRKAPRRGVPPAAETPEAGAPGEEAEELGGVGEEIELTPEQFDAVRKTLESLPRNLKIAVQDVIGEGKAAGRELSRLVALLVAGAAAEEIAALTGRITGKRIRVPAGYEKKTGAAFEEERQTFAYAFRENILPLLRIFVITTIAGGLLAYFGYSFVYRPLYAYSNYRRGYEHIRADRFALANESFSRAAGVWQMKEWYYRYAEGFADRRQYALAEGKYDELLKVFKDDRKGILDYARMESKLTDYKKSDGLLQRILDKKMYDYDALLAAGDNDIEWAAIDSGRYEAARVAYASLIEKHGARDELLFRMLRYFIRTDNGQEADRLRQYFAQRKTMRVDPEVYAEFGGYLIDHRQLDYVQDVLFRAIEAKPDLPEIHYELARYYRIVINKGDEKKALDAAVRFLKVTDLLTKKRLEIEIDTHTRLGEVFYAQKEYLAAQREFQQAIVLVETNQKRKLIGAGKVFGRPYAGLADLHYYIQGDLGLALTFYGKAIDNLYRDAEIDFKVGFINYSAGNYKAALSRFAKAEDSWTNLRGYDASEQGANAGAPSENAPSVEATAAAVMSRQVPGNLLFALGNSFYLRGDYFAAQGYYLRLLDGLMTRKAAIGTLLPQEQPEHRSLLENLAKVNNNLGVVMFRLGERMGDRRRRSEALVYLASAAEISDALARDPQTVRRTEAKNLPFLNTRGILYPLKGFELQIYRLIPKDFKALFY